MNIPASRLVGGVRMTEFTMSQAFYEVGRDRRIARLSAIGHDIDRLRESNLSGAAENQPTGWSSCIAIVNGHPMECHRIGHYTILVDGHARDTQVRLTRWQRCVLALLRAVHFKWR